MATTATKTTSKVDVDLMFLLSQASHALETEMTAELHALGVSPREQAMAIGIYSFVASAGASIGLLAGGVLTQAISWHWIFFVNLPIGIATAGAPLRLILLARDHL